MIYNVLLGNTDDHSRNHAIIYDFAQKHWRLSPAFDVLPINSSKQHGIGIGDKGRQGSVDNLLSQSKRFGLKAFKAKKMVDDVMQLIAEWPVYFGRLGVGAGDIERLKLILPEF